MGLATTNNPIKPGIHLVVLDRHGTQGTHGPQGRQWYARICSATATRV